MTEYTPGPWGLFDGTDIWPTEADGAIKYGGGYIARLRWRGPSVETETGEHSFPETESNARLIAAAPDLLEAAKAFVAINECACPTPQDMPFDEELPPFPEWIKTNRCHWHQARAAIAKAEGVE